MAFIRRKKMTPQMPVVYRRPRQQTHSRLAKLMFLKITIPYIAFEFDDDIKVVKYDENYDCDNDIVILCPIDSNRVKSYVCIIERILRSLNIKFRMMYDSAYWECHTDEFFFILRLWWDEDDRLVLEPTCFVGNKILFREFYNKNII